MYIVHISLHDTKFITKRLSNTREVRLVQNDCCSWIIVENTWTGGSKALLIEQWLSILPVTVMWSVITWSCDYVISSTALVVQRSLRWGPRRCIPRTLSELNRWFCWTGPDSWWFRDLRFEIQDGVVALPDSTSCRNACYRKYQYTQQESTEWLSVSNPLFYLFFFPNITKLTFNLPWPCLWHVHYVSFGLLIWKKNEMVKENLMNIVILIVYLLCITSDTDAVWCMWWACKDKKDIFHMTGCFFC